MKFLLLFSLSGILWASDMDDFLSSGEREFQLRRFSNEEVLLQIDRDAEIACKPNGLCVLTAVSTNDERFTVELSVGQGNNGQIGGDGNNIYLPGDYEGHTYNNNDINWGISVRYTKGRCRQQIEVPRALYYSVNRYLYGLMTEEGGVRRGFTPADEAMIMFYITIQKLATGCTAK